MAKKVQYIKIARIDQNGNDLTNTLEALTQITIPLTSAGNKTYKILTRADFPTYYLFTIDLDNTPDAATLPSTTSTTLDYGFSGSINGNAVTISGTGATPFPIITGAGLQIATDFYNSTQQRLEINTLPRKDIYISIGTTSDPSPTAFKATVTPDAGFSDSASVELFQLSSPYNQSEAVQLTFNPILDKGKGSTSISRSVSVPRASIAPGDVFFLGVKETGSGGMTVNGANVSLNNNNGGKYTGLFYVTSSAATGPELENIVEPYLVRRFTNSDCDVLINNANQYEENPFLQDIDFSSGTIVPVNYDQIVTGTAQKATVPQSMFTMGGMINPNNSGINQVDRYNISGSSYFGQTTGGTFVCYYSSHTVGGGTSYISKFILKYIITPDGELIEIKIDDDTDTFLERLFGSKANPAGLEANGLYGEDDANVNIRAIPFSGSVDDGNMEYRGRSLVRQIGSNMRLEAISRGTKPGANPGPGIVFPASIDLTSHADLPSRARQILTENNVIPPEN